MEYSNVGQYRLGNTLGRGTFGYVKVAEHLTTGEMFAAKVISRRKMCPEDLQNEIANQRSLDHRHVVKLEEVIEMEDDIIMVLELVSGGDIFDHIVQQGRLQE